MRLPTRGGAATVIREYAEGDPERPRAIVAGRDDTLVVVAYAVDEGMWLYETDLEGSCYIFLEGGLPDVELVEPVPWIPFELERGELGVFDWSGLFWSLRPHHAVVATEKSLYLRTDTRVVRLPQVYPSGAAEPCFVLDE